jgi:hypothetical protein
MPAGTGSASHVSGLSIRQRLEQERQSLLTERSSFDSHWLDLATYLMPRRSRFQVTDRNKGDRRSTAIIDSAPRFAARTLQSGMHAGLTSPARPWMRVTTHDTELAEFGPVKLWLHTVTRRMLDVFHRSNLYNALPTVYGDMGVFSSAAVAVLEDDEELLRAYPYPIGCYAFSVDGRGLVSTWVRDYQLNVRQVVDQFGRIPGTRDIDWSKLSIAVKNQWDKSNYEGPVEVSWHVCPNDEYNPRGLFARDTMRWRSYHYERGREEKDRPKHVNGADGFLRVSGFNEFPVLAPRWDVTAEDSYGTDGPGMLTLGDVKQLQLMQRNKAKAIAKALDPPLKGPPELKNQKVSHLPGDITYVVERDGRGGLQPIHEVRLEGLQYFVMDMQETRDRVRRGFYEDLFLMLAMSDGVRGAQPITAAEVAERHEEKLLALGPVLERTNDELLDPLVDRTFAMMLRAGAIPAPPQELEGIDLKVEYTSLMAQVQKLVGAAGHDRFLQSSLQLAQVFPEARHKIRVFQAIDDMADMYGVNPNLVRSDEEAQQLAQQEAEAAAAQQQAAQMKDLAAAGKSMGDTSLDGNTALNALLGRAA